MKESIKNYLKNRPNIVLLVIYLSYMSIFITNSYAENNVRSLTISEKTTQKTTSSPPSPRYKPESLYSKEQSPQERALSIKLNIISESINLLKEEIKEKSNLLKKAKTEKEKITIQNEIDDINQSIDEQENSFEMIQTGGLDLEKIETSHEKAFDWQKDLLEILQPIMRELRQFTEDKRKIIDLENKISFYQSQVHDASSALKNMDRINKENLEKDTLERFEQKNKKWQNLLDENNHRLGIAQMQLNGMINLQSEEELLISDYIKEFVLGRGATILMSLLAFVVVYFSLLLVWRGIMWFSKRNQGDKLSYSQRISGLIYRAMMVILSVSASFYVLNLRNDQVLVAMAVLLLVITFWILRNSLPQYLKELQLVLNAGPVREGQRMVYNGVPMRIGSLNYYTKLTNPALPGVVVHLPLSHLSNYISRQYDENEPWFPCLEGDYVILSDETYGKVKFITLENIILTQGADIMPKTYAINDFLAAHPKNLSHGFSVISDFGIDYKYQAESTTKIPKLLRIGIQEGLLQEAYGKYLKEISVRFVLANISSLDYKIIALFDGQAAGDYFSIKHDLQRYAVEVCNQEKLEIPFNQIVVHTSQS